MKIYIIFGLTLMLTSCSLFKDKNGELEKAFKYQDVDKIIKLLDDGADPSKKHQKEGYCLAGAALLRLINGEDLKKAANDPTKADESGAQFRFQGTLYWKRDWDNWTPEKLEKILFHLVDHGGADCVDDSTLDEKTRKMLKNLYESAKKQGANRISLKK